jgi:hypothetical protein
MVDAVEQTLRSGEAIPRPTAVAIADVDLATYDALLGGA